MMRNVRPTLLAIVALVMASASGGVVRSATAPTAASVEPTMPSEDQLFNAWPEQARQMGIEGAVELYCVYQGVSQPRCSIASERPVGMGFGRAELGLTPSLTMTVIQGADGKPATIVRRPTITFACGARCKPFPAWDISIVWAAAPTADDVRAAYPPAALAAGSGGLAVIACRFTAEGALVDCKADPGFAQGADFSTAALSLAGKFRASGNLKDIPVRIPVRFQVNNGQVVTATPPARDGPTVFDIIGAIPAGAKTPGQATLACRIGSDGKFDICAARLETPTGAGFGAAALGLKDKYRFNLWTPAGLPVIGAVMAAPFTFPDPHGPRPSIISNPEWLRQPTPADMNLAYPARAKRLGAGGKANLSCTVQSDGKLNDCTLSEESPANLGFGDAVLSLVPKFAMKPQTRDGAPVAGARVSIPVIFSLQ